MQSKFLLVKSHYFTSRTEEEIWSILERKMRFTWVGWKNSSNCLYLGICKNHCFTLRSPSLVHSKKKNHKVAYTSHVYMKCQTIIELVGKKTIPSGIPLEHHSITLQWVPWVLPVKQMQKLFIHNKTKRNLYKKTPLNSCCHYEYRWCMEYCWVKLHLICR